MENLISKEDLQNLYEVKSSREISEMLGVTKPTIIKLLRELGIPIRPRGAQRKIIIKG